MSAATVTAMDSQQKDADSSGYLKTSQEDRAECIAVVIQVSQHDGVKNGLDKLDKVKAWVQRLILGSVMLSQVLSPMASSWVWELQFYSI